jgi:pre-rRNA-processing protein IPI1
LTPHSPIILLFATSAQTHIFPEIRLDAVRFIDLFLDFMPQIVVQGWEEPGNTNGKRVLDGYLGFLSAGSKFGEAGGRSFPIIFIASVTYISLTDTETVQPTSTASVVLSPSVSQIAIRNYHWH